MKDLKRLWEGAGLCRLCTVADGGGGFQDTKVERGRGNSTLEIERPECPGSGEPAGGA